MDQNPFEALCEDEFDEFEEVENPYRYYCDRWKEMLNVKPIRLRSRSHSEKDVVLRDVNRSLWRFSFCTNWTETMRDMKRDSLRHVLDACFSALKPEGHYYQGFHDVAEVCFAVCGYDEELALGMTLALARRYFVDATRPDLTRVALALRLIVNVVLAADPELARVVFCADTVAREPVWALSWIITWFAHNVDDFDILLTLWDTILCVDHAAFPLYLAAALVVQSKQKLVDFEDGPSLYSTFSKLPKHVSKHKWIAVSREAKILLRDHPPTTLWTHRLPSPDLKLMLKPLQLELALAHFYQRRTRHFLVFVLYAIWTRRPGAILLLASRHLLPMRNRKQITTHAADEYNNTCFHQQSLAEGIALLGSASSSPNQHALTTTKTTSQGISSSSKERGGGGVLATLRANKSSASILVAGILAALLGSSDFFSTSQNLVRAFFPRC